MLQKQAFLPVTREKKQNPSAASLLLPAEREIAGYSVCFPQKTTVMV